MKTLLENKKGRMRKLLLVLIISLIILIPFGINASNNQTEVDENSEIIQPLEQIIDESFVEEEIPLEGELHGEETNVTENSEEEIEITFNETEEIIEVALVSGNVKVIDLQGNETMLNPLDAAIYSKTTKTIKKQGFDARLVTSWKDNILLFDKATIPQIVERLENWYGVKITIDLDNPISGLYSGEYRDESLEMVLNGIGYTSGFQYSIDGNYITIKN